MTADASPRPEVHVRRYACFITYRHADNKDEGRRWAEWLHYALETYEVPRDLIGKPNERGEPIPASLYPVFRDEAELSADSDFSDNIRRALENSTALIVLCSPRACESQYVADEITYFKELGKADRILALIVDGEPNADGPDKAGTAAECFPKQLRYGVPKPDGKIDWTQRTQPLAADVRPGGRNEQGWTGANFYRAALEKEGSGGSSGALRSLVKEYGARLELAKLKLIAGILALPLGQLIKRDAEYRAQKFRRLAVTFGLLALIALAAGAFAILQKREAERQRQAAQTNEQRAVATLANSDFREGINRLSQPQTSGEGMAFLARAVRLGKHPAAEARLWTLFQQRRFWVEVPVSVSAPLAAPSSDSATPDARFAMVTYGGQRLAPAWFSRSADGSTCVTIVNGEDHSGVHHFRVWKSDGRPITDWITVPYSGLQWVGPLVSAHLSQDGRFVAVVASIWREPEILQVWDTRKRAQIGADIPASGGSPNYQNAPFTDVRFIPQRSAENSEAELLVTTSARGDASVFAVSEEGTSVELVARCSHTASVRVAAVDSQAQWLMSASDDGQVMIHELQQDDLVGQPIRVRSAVKALARIAEDRLQIISRGDEVTEYRLFPALKLPAPAETTLHRIADAKPYDDGKLDEGGPNAVRLPEVGSLLATSEDGRQLARLTGPDELAVLEVRPDKTEVLVWKQRMSAAIIGARYTEQRDRLLVQTDSFVTEILDGKSGQRIGLPIDEARLFSEGERPAKSFPSMLARGENRVLTRSFFWNPPNVAEYWFTVWDLASGLAMVNRLHISDDGLNDDALTHAELNDGGNVLLLGREEAKTATSSIQFVPPASLAGSLADFAEALGGLKIEPGGDFSAVPNQVERVESFFAEAAKTLPSSSPR